MVRLRDFFGWLSTHHFSESAIEGSLWFTLCGSELKLEQSRSEALTSELVERGYLVSDSSGYKFADKAFELQRASAAGQASRKTVESVLAGVLQRSAEYNRDDNYPLRIEALVVFGSFLSGKAKLGDLDLCVKSVERYPHEEVPLSHWRYRYAAASGREFSNIGQKWRWPENELALKLKARKRTVSILPWDEILWLAQEDFNFRYRVVFGDDPAKITEEIETAKVKQ